jgi:hypothetical protein
MLQTLKILVSDSDLIGTCSCKKTLIFQHITYPYQCTFLFPITLIIAVSVFLNVMAQLLFKIKQCMHLRAQLKKNTVTETWLSKFERKVLTIYIGIQNIGQKIPVPVGFQTFARF